MLNIKENIPLKDFTTFQTGGNARYFAIVKNDEDLRQAFIFIKSRKLPFFVLGGGSNILMSDQGFNGLVIKNEIKGIKFIDLPAQTNGEVDKVLVEIGAGENLDELVNLSVIRNLFGLENLSGIPGTIGGAAVQNAGAYGMEIKDNLLIVHGINSDNGKKYEFNKADCLYNYRDSIFKRNKKYIIISVTLELNKRAIVNLEYAGLKEILGGEKDISSQKIRETILKIRSEKLPDWHKLGTAGSFFKNPIVKSEKYTELKMKYQNIPGFSGLGEKVKVPLAWILDNVCDLKNYRENNVGLYDKQPIVIVNYGGATSKEIKNFSDKIKKIVKEKTGIEIEEEIEKIN